MSQRTKKAERPILASACATAEGTRQFAARHRSAYAADFYRESRTALSTSSIAFGTYLGDCDDTTDARYAEALEAALTRGVNVIDSAINYRCQRSERVVGRVTRKLMLAGVIARDQIVLCTKAGYVPLDGTPPANRDEYQAYLRRVYFDSGIVTEKDLVGGAHSMAPSFLVDQLRRSRENLGVDCVDYFYLHNPEQQLSSVDRDEFKRRLIAAFETLEGFVAAGAIASYGCATWNGLRLPAGSQGHLSMYELAAIAKDVAGDRHHFRILQLPINLTMSEALRVSTQRDARGRLVNVTAAAAELEIDLVASAPLLQGQLTANWPPQLKELFPGDTDAQRALAFARTIPGVLAAAVGMRSVEHVLENLAGASHG
jgi:aryl-alcohol dehydrogenase-like predicted oxidoreductase